LFISVAAELIAAPLPGYAERPQEIDCGPPRRFS